MQGSYTIKRTAMLDFRCQPATRVGSECRRTNRIDTSLPQKPGDRVRSSFANGKARMDRKDLLRNPAYSASRATSQTRWRFAPTSAQSSSNESVFRLVEH